jgi:hypothetical protein
MRGCHGESRQVCHELVSLVGLCNIHHWIRRPPHAHLLVEIEETAGWLPSTEIIQETVDFSMKTPLTDNLLQSFSMVKTPRILAPDGLNVGADCRH